MTEALTPVCMGEKSCEKSFILLPLKLLLLAHYGTRKVLFTGLAECGGVIAYYILSNGNNQAHTSHDTAKPDRATHKKHGNQVGDAAFGATCAFNTSKEHLKLHPLWQQWYTQTLSAYVVYTAGPSQAIHLVAKIF